MTSRQRNHFETKFLKAFFLLSEFIPSSLRLALFLFSLLDGVATPLHYRGEAHKASCYSTIEVITPCIGISIEKFEQRKKTVPRRMNRSKPDDGKYQVKLVCDDQVYIACEQSKPREGAASRSRVLARLASLAQIGELARRLKCTVVIFCGLKKIGHFRVPKTFTSRTRLRAKPFLKRGYVCMRIKKNYNINGFALSIALKQREFLSKNRGLKHQTFLIHERHVWPRKTGSGTRFACQMQIVKQNNVKPSRTPTE